MDTQHSQDKQDTQSDARPARRDGPVAAVVVVMVRPASGAGVAKVLVMINGCFL